MMMIAFGNPAHPAAEMPHLSDFSGKSGFSGYF
jgi:hypothetical protein